MPASQSHNCRVIKWAVPQTQSGPPDTILDGYGAAGAGKTTTELSKEKSMQRLNVPKQYI